MFRVLVTCQRSKRQIQKMSAWAEEMENEPLPDNVDPAETTAPTPPPGPKKLHLQPRGATSEASVESKWGNNTKSNPFGAAKPREEVLLQKGVNPEVIEAKIEAKVARPQLTKEQQEAVDALQAEIDSNPSDDSTKKMQELMASFKEVEIEKKAPRQAVPRFERPSERRARLEQERGGGSGGYERQGNFGSFNSRGGESRPGDWPCPSCNANNFASRNSCFKCHVDRPDGGSYGGDNFGSFNNRGGRGGGGESRPGDWPCPSCNANNFASRNSCFKCHVDRP